MKVRLLTMLAMLLVLAGCDYAVMKLGGYDCFDASYVQADHLYAALISITTQRVAIVSDCAVKQLPKDGSPKRRSGSFLTANGQEILWACETADKEAFSRIIISGTEHQYAKGNTFLISSKGSKLRVLQLQLADNKITDLAKFRRDNPDARKFFDPSQAEGQR
jgi:hypothetical protein